MNEIKIIEALAAEIERAAAAGDRDRAQKLADLQIKVIAQIGRDMLADVPAASVSVAPAPAKQLAQVARRISTEALAAELAAERTDWETVHATYARLGLLFAEYRLLYVQCLPPSRTIE